VWRDTACGSHFVLWNDRIFLFSADRDALGEDRQEPDASLVDAVRDRLSTARPSSYVDVAYALEEVPWDVLSACRYLARIGAAKEGEGKNRGEFTKM
jgi:hypothetical protein